MTKETKIYKQCAGIITIPWNKLMNDGCGYPYPLIYYIPQYGMKITAAPSDLPTKGGGL